MASKIPQYRIWDSARNHAKKYDYEEAVKLYRGIEADFTNLAKWRPEKSETDILFDQAMFFSDYCGTLADAGLYADALEKGNIALVRIQQGNFTTIRYIYYNMGQIYLFQKQYMEAVQWYEKALDRYFQREKIAERAELNYLINYGIAVYHISEYDKAEKAFSAVIEYSKGSKYAGSFEPYFYMSKLSVLHGNDTMADKYNKMYLSRLKKYSDAEIKWSISSMEEKNEILADYRSENRQAPANHN